MPYLPVSIATIRAFGPIRRRAKCRAELVEQASGQYRGRIVLTDDAGSVIAEITGIELRPVDVGALRLPLEHKIFDAEWVHSATSKIDPDRDRVAAGSWLLLADPDPETETFAADIAARLSSPTRRVIIRRAVGRFDSGAGFREKLLPKSSFRPRA